jgi:hypothetical protein
VVLVGVGVAIALHWRMATVVGNALVVVCLLGAVLAGLVCGAGLLVLGRYRRALTGQPDLFLSLAAARREERLTAEGGFRGGRIRRLLARLLLSHDFLVGDEVEIRPLSDILATLDESGMLEGIPFQPEMANLCGRRLRIFRCVDKIFDYGRTKRMRRLERCVLLVGLRCDGADHGGCQAMCYLLWKTQWLKPLRAPAAESGTAGGRIAPTFADVTEGGKVMRRYMCQYTQLHGATRPLHSWNLLQEVRPLVAGNVTLAGFLVGLGTRLFNRVQVLRHGNGFPFLPFAPDKPETPETAPMAIGDLVKVRPVEQIVRTLNRRYRNKGLWFDRDMVKHCGTTHRVLVRVERIIDDSNGEMLQMKTPSLLLSGADYSGEFLNFSAQHDYFFWRESWLEHIKEVP